MPLSGGGAWSAPASSFNPAVNDTDISATDWNALLADLTTALSTAIYKDGQSTTTVRIPFAQGINSTLATDATSITTGSIITAGGISAQKALWIGGLANIAGAVTLQSTLAVTNTITGTKVGAAGAITAANSAFAIAAAGATDYAGTYYPGSTVYDSFFGRAPLALTGVNDALAYATVSAGTATARVIFSSAGLGLTQLNDDGGHLIISSTNPTIASGFGTGPTITANNTAAFKVVIGTGSTDSAGIITMPAAPNGWVAKITVVNAVFADLLTKQTASTTTSISVANYRVSTGANVAWNAGDVLYFQCTAF